MLTFKSKSNSKSKKFFRPVHLHAILFLVIYNIVSKANLVQALTIKDPLVSFLRIYLFGVIASFVFLYIFSHEDFLPFAKDIEKEEDKKEKKYLKKYRHYGKILGSFVIGGIGGPILIALTLRFFFHKKIIRYPLLFLITLVSTFLMFGIVKGFIHIL